MRFLSAWLAACCFGAQDPAPVVVNGKELTAAELRQVRELAQRYHVKVMPGRYWYDAGSGLWGYEGQAAMGTPATDCPGRDAANVGGGGIVIKDVLRACS